MNLPKLTDATLQIEQRVALLTLQRDDVRNALTGTALADDIIAAARWANRFEEVSVLVLTGAGKAFSAGGNIRQMKNRQGIFAGSCHQIEHSYRYGIQQIPRALDSVEVPIIAAVNGPAIGAGFDLANMCDLRIASKQARFGETFVTLGLVPGDGGAWLLQRAVGCQRAFELALTGRVLDADEALAIGLVLEVVEPDQLLNHALALAQAIAAHPPLAVRQTKRLLKLARHQALAEHLDFCAALQAMCHHTQDHTEALAAFMEKRHGRYTGQ